MSAAVLSLAARKHVERQSACPGAYPPVSLGKRFVSGVGANYGKVTDFLRRNVARKRKHLGDYGEAPVPQTKWWYLNGSSSVGRSTRSWTPPGFSSDSACRVLHSSLVVAKAITAFLASS